MLAADFLLAIGERTLAEHLLNFRLQDIEKANLLSPVHQKLMKLFRQYCVVGGMPEAIARYES